MSSAVMFALRSRAITRSIHSSASSVPPCFKVLLFRSRAITRSIPDPCHPCRSVVRFCSSGFSPRLRVSVVKICFCLTIFFSSITSSGHSGQLCSQQTMMSQPFTSCMCRRKFRLSYSNSIFTGLFRSFPATRTASQSGNSVCILSIRNPRLAAMAPNSAITPPSFVGP